MTFINVYSSYVIHFKIKLRKNILFCCKFNDILPSLKLVEGVINFITNKNRRYVRLCIYKWKVTDICHPQCYISTEITVFRIVFSEEKKRYF